MSKQRCGVLETADAGLCFLISPLLAAVLLASEFVNQDADPWVWEVYRRMQLAVFCPGNVLLENGIGGTAGDPRYTRQHVHWQDKLVADGVRVVLTRHGDAVARLRVPRIDVGIPSYRVPVPHLRLMLETLLLDTDDSSVASGKKRPLDGGLHPLMSLTAVLW